MKRKDLETRLYRVIGADGNFFLGVINKHAIESATNSYKDCNLACGDCQYYQNQVMIKYNMCQNPIVINKFVEYNRNIYI